MLENSVVQISTGKLLGVSLLSNSILLLSGIIIWRVWQNRQSHLQTEADALINELGQIKKQIADLHTSYNKAESDESMQPVNKFTAAQQSSPKSTKSAESPVKMGLFEYLIEDNIQLRQSTS